MPPLRIPLPTVDENTRRRMHDAVGAPPPPLFTALFNPFPMPLREDATTQERRRGGGEKKKEGANEYYDAYVF